MCLLLLPGAADRRGESPLVTLLKRLYRARLPAVVAQPRWSLLGLAAVVVVAGVSAPFLGEEFMPKFKETDFLMHWVEKPGASIDAMNRVTILASKELRAVPGVQNFGSHIGRAEVADEVVGPNFTELWISLDPAVDYESTVDTIQEIVDGYPGLQRDLLTYLRERIKEVLTGTSARIRPATCGVPRRPSSAAPKSARSTTSRRSSTWPCGACPKCGATWPRCKSC
jgi:Cu/Ag efflux pump CusA